MADSVDRVFAQALHTVRRLPRHGSTRPPAQARLRLYGLYKQSMEGDVDTILPRPGSPPALATPPQAAGEDDNDDDHHDNGAARPARGNEAKGEQQKWDAWYACRGMSRTEAKKRYIEVLIETMKVYAAGTVESRELVAELEFVWGQIRSQTGTRAGSEEGIREVDRVGVEGRLRVLSPMSRGNSGEIVQGEDASVSEREHASGDDDDADGMEREVIAARIGSQQRNTPRPPKSRRRPSPDPRDWRRQIEAALSKISTEIAALREQMDELNSSSYARSAFGFGRQKAGLLGWMKWLVWIALRQLAVSAVFLGVLLLWGVWRRDDRFEKWVGRRWMQLRRFVEGLRWETLVRKGERLVAMVVPARLAA